MKPSIILLIRFIVPQILFCSGEKSKWKNPKMDFRKYITVHKITQEDVIDLNSMKPEDLMMLKSSVFKGFKKGHSDVVKGPYPTKHNSRILAPSKELNLTINNTKLSKYFENHSPKSRDENEDNSIPKTNPLQQIPELEVIKSKYMKKYSQISKRIGNDQSLISNNIKPIQKNHLMGEKYNVNYGPLMNPAEKPFVNKETIEPKKKYLNPQYGHSDFKSKLGVLHDSDKIYQPQVLKENKGKVLESMNNDKSSTYDHRIKNDPEQRKWAKNIFSSQTTNKKSYETALGRNSLLPGNSQTSEVPSKQNVTKDSSHILTSSDSFNPIPFSKTKSSKSGDFFESPNIPSMQAGVDYRVQNGAVAVTTLEVPASYNEKIRGVNLPTSYYNGQKETNKESDINDVIQVDLFEDFIYQPPNNASDKEPRQKKNIEGTEKEVTPWKTVDLVLAGFAILTVFVLMTICMTICSRRKHAEDMEDEDDELGCWESTRKKFVLGVGFLGVYLITYFSFALEELDKPKNPKPQSYSKMKTKQPLRKPVITNARKDKKKKNVKFYSALPSSSGTPPPSNTTASIPMTTTGSLSGRSSLEQTSSNRVPSLPTVSSNSPPAVSLQPSSENGDPFNIPSSRGFPSVTVVPSIQPSVLRARPPSEGNGISNSQSSNELPSLPTVSSTSSNDNFSRQPPTVAGNTQNLNDTNRNKKEPKWHKFRKRPR